MPISFWIRGKFTHKKRKFDSSLPLTKPCFRRSHKRKHVMAYRLFGAKPLPELVMAYCQLHISVKLLEKFIQENLFENIVCKVVTISCRHQCINSQPNTQKMMTRFRHASLQEEPFHLTCPTTVVSLSSIETWTHHHQFIDDIFKLIFL